MSRRDSSDTRAISARLCSEIIRLPRDTIMEITFRPGPEESVKIQGKARPSRRVAFSDGSSEFTAWVSPAGRMLRLDQPASGLRVERVADARPIANPTAVKPATPAGTPGAPISPPPVKPPGGR